MKRHELLQDQHEWLQEGMLVDLLADEFRAHLILVLFHSNRVLLLFITRLLDEGDVHVHQLYLRLVLIC